MVRKEKFCHLKDRKRLTKEEEKDEEIRKETGKVGHDRETAAVVKRQICKVNEKMLNRME